VVAIRRRALISVSSQHTMATPNQLSALMSLQRPVLLLKVVLDSGLQLLKQAMSGFYKTK